VRDIWCIEGIKRNEYCFLCLSLSIILHSTEFWRVTNNRGYVWTQKLRPLFRHMDSSFRTGIPHPVQRLPETISHATSLLLRTGKLALSQRRGIFLAVMSYPPTVSKPFLFLPNVTTCSARLGLSLIQIQTCPMKQNLQNGK
jgi:hypothetical protein